MAIVISVIIGIIRANIAYITFTISVRIRLVGISDCRAVICIIRYPSPSTSGIDVVVVVGGGHSCSHCGWPQPPHPAVVSHKSPKPSSSASNCCGLHTDGQLSQASPIPSLSVSPGRDLKHSGNYQMHQVCRHHHYQLPLRISSTLEAPVSHLYHSCSALHGTGYIAHLGW